MYMYCQVVRAMARLLTVCVFAVITTKIPCAGSFTNVGDHVLAFELSMLGNFCCRLLTFSEVNLFLNSFRNTIRVSNSLDPDQDRQNVGPDLDPDCLQR